MDDLVVDLLVMVQTHRYPPIFKDSSKITEVSHGLKYSFFVYFYCIILRKKLYEKSYKIGKSCTKNRTS